MKASVIIVTHVGTRHLEDSLGSLVAYGDRADVEIVVVDNATSDGCAAQVARRWPWAHVVRSEVNLGFTGGVHAGVDAASGETLVLLNDDAAAEQGLVEAHLGVLADNPQAAVSAGRLVDWDRKHHDFVRGAMTFDVHAFQLGQGYRLDDIEPPADGEEMPFACGGNMAIRRSDWEASGGFDRGLFAYFEDIDLGWRLWARGRAVVAAPAAVARHRGSATTAALGDFRRGVLFERNALRVFHTCADQECRLAFGSAVWATFVHRLTAFSRERPELARAVADPFGAEGLIPSRRHRWVERLRTQGVLGSLRHAALRAIGGRRVGKPVLEDGFMLMQLRAAQGFFAEVDGAERRRRELATVRTVPDHEIMERFPRLIVPTYAGDAEWFGSEAFMGLLPDGWPLERRELSEIMR